MLSINLLFYNHFVALLSNYPWSIRKKRKEAAHNRIYRTSHHFCDLLQSTIRPFYSRHNRPPAECPWLLNVAFLQRISARAFFLRTSSSPLERNQHWNGPASSEPVIETPNRLTGSVGRTTEHGIWDSASSLAQYRLASGWGCTDEPTTYAGESWIGLCRH